jgi:hypothetical protein
MVQEREPLMTELPQEEKFEGTEELSSGRASLFSGISI